MSLLEARGIHKSFGALQALGGVDLCLERGEILGVIGPNGSGKTTLFNCMTGILRPDSGRVVFGGRDITGWPTHRICRAGLVKTSQIVRPFLGMSVLENVLVGGLYGKGLLLKRARAQALEILEQVGLAEAAAQPAGSITVAMRRRLELARCLATGPQAILLDENLAGLTPVEIAESLALLRSLNAQGLSLVVVEHVMQAVMGVSQRVMVLDYGQKIAEGPPAQVVADRRVIEAFLGEEYA
ncbi:MAG: ABC transporter ATP-binding protein [Desulfarculus sp.]|nr:MAG: ABC transporter ATP-binding protein [Desulfarculus sp.]